MKNISNATLIWSILGILFFLFLLINNTGLTLILCGSFFLTYLFASATTLGFKDKSDRYNIIKIFNNWINKKKIL